MKNNLFKQAYFEIESQIKADKVLMSSIVSIALLGSAADGEQSGTWSDLDVLVILKTDELGNIEIENLNRLQKIASDATNKYDFPISILSHSLDDFEKYVAFEYLKHYSFGLCTFPSSDYLQKTISGILSKRNISEDVRKAYCAYHTRHIRFNLLRKYVSMDIKTNPKAVVEFAKLLIDKMIKTTDLSLNYVDVWPTSKGEISTKAKEVLHVDNQILEQALVLRKNWASISADELKIFIPKGLGYIKTVSNIVLKDYKQATPEEKMPL